MKDARSFDFFLRYTCSLGKKKKKCLRIKSVKNLHGQSLEYKQRATSFDEKNSRYFTNDSNDLTNINPSPQEKRKENISTNFQLKVLYSHSIYLPLPKLTQVSPPYHGLKGGRRRENEREKERGRERDATVVQPTKLFLI